MCICKRIARSSYVLFVLPLLIWQVVYQPVLILCFAMEAVFLENHLMMPFVLTVSSYVLMCQVAASVCRTVRFCSYMLQCKLFEFLLTIVSFLGLLLGTTTFLFTNVNGFINSVSFPLWLFVLSLLFDMILFLYLISPLVYNLDRTLPWFSLHVSGWYFVFKAIKYWLCHLTSRRLYCFVLLVSLIAVCSFGMGYLFYCSIYSAIHLQKLAPCNLSVCFPINCLEGGNGSSQMTGKQKKSSGSACQDRINKRVRPSDDSHSDKEQNENNGAENPPQKK